MQGIHLRKYGVQTTINFDLYEVDGVDLRVDASHASGDSKIMKNEAAEANTSNSFTDEGQGYSIVLTATEMQAARVVLYIVDQGTKAWLDKVIVVETYGNASAMHAMDFDDSVRAGLTALPNAAADAAGGLPISDGGGLDLDAILADTAALETRLTAARAGYIDNINGHTAQTGDSYARLGAPAGASIVADIAAYAAYAGPRGPGIYLNDAAGNTNTVDGVDGTITNPVSTIAAAKTIADSLSFDRIYLVNDTAITLAATMEDYEFVGIGDVAANSVNLGSQDVDNAYFENVLISGAQGGTGRFMAYKCALSTLTSLEVLAWECAIVNNLTVRDDCYFDKCWSAVAGNATPTLDINSVANVDISWRHYSGGLQVDNAVATTTMSFESDGQIIVDATCNASFALTVRGSCSITDNASLSSLTRDAALNKTDLAAAAWDASGGAHVAAGSMGAALGAAAKLVQISDMVNDVTPTTTVFTTNGLDGSNDDLYNGCILIFTTGPLTGIGRRIDDYVSSTKTITLENALPVAPNDGEAFVISGIEVQSAAAGSGDWTTGEKNDIRQALGVTGTKGSPTGGDLQTLMLLLTQLPGSVNDVAPQVTSFTGNAGLSATNSFYTGMYLMFTSGTLAGLTRKITDYDGTTKMLSFADPWVVAPANGDTFYVLPERTEQSGDSFGRLGAPSGASIAADILVINGLVDDLESRLTAARAGYLDNINGHTAQTGDSYARLGAPAGASVSADIAANQVDLTTLLSRLSAARAGYLDELAAGNLPTDVAAIQTDVDTLLVRLSAGRAGYLDNLNGHTPQTGDSYARLGAPVGASISADVAGVPAAYEATVGESEGSYTVAQIRRVMFSVLAGRTSSGGVVFKTPDNAKTRATYTTDGSNNRTAATLTPDA